MDTVSGYVDGIVTNNVDPEGCGRIKVRIPGTFPDGFPHWVHPACWPGAGGPGVGSQYPPPPIDSPVYIMFKYGAVLDPDAEAIYFTGYYGLVSSTMQSAGPNSVHAAPTPARAIKRVCIWEDDTFIFYIVNDEEQKKLVLQTQAGSAIEVNAADGTGGKSETIKIEARTGISIFSHGVIDINGLQVQIQGRPVNKLTSKPL